jgi:hypothetical protein
MTKKAQPFTAAKRRSMIRTLNAAYKTVVAASADGVPAASARADVDARYAKAQKRYRDCAEAYEKALPRIALSRCPFSGEVVRLAIDNLGLDGPWWNRDVPVRPVDELPASVFAITGAVDFGKTPPKTDFVCMPGPGAPYVVPRLLTDPAIKAVVSSIPIGKHNAYAVVYFAQDTPYDLARINRWGIDHYLAETADGEGYRMFVPDYWIDFDFDLNFYIETGRLLWTAPGDAELTLHATLRHCPYLDLPGHRYPVGLLDGATWNSLIDADAHPKGAQAA